MFDFSSQASFWKSKNNSDTVECTLCPRCCVINNGKRGFCNIRENKDGVLYSLGYGYPVALQIDPIEKKPFAEFMSGTKTFSIGTFGCNLNCLFCQNYHLSRGSYTENQQKQSRYFSPELIIELAAKNNCKSVAFTYNEPSVWVEYAIDIAKRAKEKGLAVVLVSNGYISRKAAEEFYPLIDAANIDMKGFSEDFYRKMTDSHLEPVLNSIKYLYSLSKHVEITNLIIPGKNDSDDMISAYFDWMETSLSKQVPLHFSAYHPMYKYKESPRTSPKILYNIRNLAVERGFENIYLGNI